MNTYKLGKLKPKFDRRTLMFSKYLDVAMPYAPDVCHWPNAAPLGMLLNDQIGDCTIAGALHMQRLWAKANKIEFTPTDQQAVEAYSAVTGMEGAAYNPITGENDNGCALLDVLTYWRKNGIGGKKIGAFVQVDPSNHDHVKHAIFFFGGLYIGANLPLSAMDLNPTVGWHVPKTGLVGKGAPGSAGGHCVTIAGYTPTQLDVTTWGMRIPMGWDFWDSYVDECYAIISPDFIANPVSGPNGISMTDLIHDLQLVSL